MSVLVQFFFAETAFFLEAFNRNEIQSEGERTPGGSGQYAAREAAVQVGRGKESGTVVRDDLLNL